MKLLTILPASALALSVSALALSAQTAEPEEFAAPEISFNEAVEIAQGAAEGNMQQMSLEEFMDKPAYFADLADETSFSSVTIDGLDGTVLVKESVSAATPEALDAHIEDLAMEEMGMMLAGAAASEDGLPLEMSEEIFEQLHAAEMDEMADAFAEMLKNGEFDDDLADIDPEELKAQLDDLVGMEVPAELIEELEGEDFFEALGTLNDFKDGELDAELEAQLKADPELQAELEAELADGDADKAAETGETSN